MINVLFLRPQPAIRSLKYALGFRSINAEIRLYHGYTSKTLTELYGYGDEYFEKFIKLDLKNLEEDIKEAVSKYNISLIHSQNAPDFLTVSAIIALNDVPIIHGNQDTISLRETPYYPGADVEKQLVDERVANEDCDARIHVTEEMRTYINEKYGSKRDVVFCNYVSDSMMPTSFKEKLSEKDKKVHIVYEGTLASLEGDHYDLQQIFKDIASYGMHIHIYDSHSNKDYQKLAEGDGFIHYHGHLDPRNLFREMTQYDFGWSGFNVAKNKAHMDVALPNKTFEYLACGLPVLSFPHEAQKKFLLKHGVGLVFKDLEEMQEKLANNELARKIHKNVLWKRSWFTVERNIHKITELYYQTISSYRSLFHGS
jgi:glycosyltransferase involved in cell wall biosynthesis